MEDDLYRLQNHSILKKALVIYTNGTILDIELWHRRIGHINNEKLKYLKNVNLVKRFSLKEETYIHLCKGYVERKCHKQKFPKDGGEQTLYIHLLVVLCK